ncbi:MAG: MerR family transcriptional regulator [Pseudomonadota bacterium]
METPALPNKPYFRIGEVAELLGVETHVLRYWENEFPHLSPTRAPSGQRLYRRPDVAKLLIIRGLPYAEGYTIAGARRKLEELDSAEAPAVAPAQASLFSPAAPAAPAAAIAASAAEPVPAEAAFAPPQPEVVGEVLTELKDLLRILS